jgi:hypothetical protein
VKIGNNGSKVRSWCFMLKFIGLILGFGWFKRFNKYLGC